MAWIGFPLLGGLCISDVRSRPRNAFVSMKAETRPHEPTRQLGAPLHLPKKTLLVTAGVIAVAWSAWAVSPHRFRSHTVTGASGEAQGGGLSLRSSVGQPTVDNSAAGDLRMRGGFWSGARIYPTANDPAPVRPGVQLNPPQPNPFNPRTTLSFDLDRTETVRLVIHDTRGRRVRVLADREFTAGHHAVIWNGTSDDGSTVASGVYYVLLVSDRATRTQKLTLQK